MQKKLLLILLRPLTSLLIVGSIIGYFHKYDFFLLVLLFCILVYRLYKDTKINPEKNKVYILLAGTFISAVLGVCAEIWGIENGYWLYYDLSNNRQFPYWLPLAWGLTFMFFYRIEENILNIIKINTLKSKVIMLVALSAILPTFGEIITIQLGVWIYTWPYQFFGVPLLAIFLLVVFHTSIFFFFIFICKKYNIKNKVFNNS
ncbi:MAG: hypothetical protein CL623_02850 [Arcobacter sp.]|nr:hypothetical protein [Arcobacter sp.]|tara:strand:- start:4138 stop:4746 length:609 start_codon:yes stop_codon:yes gene_type:complete